MEHLIKLMRSALSSSFSLYLTTHGYHWNVEGEDFYQIHNLLQDQYKELWAAIDDIGELIRSVDEYAQQSLSGMASHSLFDTPEYEKRMTAKEMVVTLLEAHDKMIMLWGDIVTTATELEEHGLANFAGSRAEAHQKHRWMLRSILR